MIAIAVDDEALMLGALVAAVEASPDITKVAKFSDCEEALEFVKNNPADIAFLDINMRGMGGLALAEKIIAARPNCGFHPGPTNRGRQCSQARSGFRPGAA